jgi:hypothetical protein
MEPSVRARRVGLWGGVMMGALLFACGPVPEDGGAYQEEARGEEGAKVALSGRSYRDDFVPAPFARRGPAVTYGSGKFLVGWGDVRPGNEYATRVKPDGTVLDPEGIRINVLDESDFGSQPAIAYDGKNFQYAWRSDDGISLARVKPDGTLLGTPRLVKSSDDVFPPLSIACSSKVCLVAYVVSGDDADVVHFTLVRTDGTVLVRDGRFGIIGSNPSVAWNGKDFLVVWDDARGGDDTHDIYGARVKSDGTVRDPGGFPIAVEEGPQLSPAVVWTGRRFLVAWHDARLGAAYDIFGARVHPSGRVDDPEGFPIATSPGIETRPRLAHHNDKTLVVWNDYRDGVTRVRGARVGEDGEVWDPEGFTISGGEYAHEFLADVAYGGGRFLVAYGGSEDIDPDVPHVILATRVTHETRVLDSPARVLTLAPRDAAGPGAEAPRPGR